MKDPKAILAQLYLTAVDECTPKRRRPKLLSRREVKRIEEKYEATQFAIGAYRYGQTGFVSQAEEDDYYDDMIRRHTPS